MYEIKLLHFSNVQLVFQPKNPTYVFPDDPQVNGFGSICVTFLVSLWSSKQNYVLCLT